MINLLKCLVGTSPVWLMGLISFTAAGGFDLLSSCSVVRTEVPKYMVAAGVDPSAPLRVEVGSRSVVGIVLFDAIGIGLFIPSKAITSALQEGAYTVEAAAAPAGTK